MNKYTKVYEKDFDKKDYKKASISEVLPGQKATLVGKITKIDKKTVKGDDYIIAKLSNANGSVLQFIWANLPIYKFISEEIENDTYVEIQCVVNMHKEKSNDQVNISIENISLIETSDTESIPSEDTLKEELRNRINAITNKFLKSLIIEVLKEPRINNNMFVAPATEKTAYSYRGGVAHLIIDTMDLSEKTAFALNSNFNQHSMIVDIDLLTASALLSNIGRLYTLEFNNKMIVKTDEGQLENDSIYARDIVSKKIDYLLEQKDEEGKPIYEIEESYIRELLHIISSAKGRPEFGALTIPRSKHAVILNNINNIIYTKGLFEKLEKESEVSDEKYIKLYDSGRVYFINQTAE